MWKWVPKIRSVECNLEFGGCHYFLAPISESTTGARVCPITLELGLLENRAKVPVLFKASAEQEQRAPHELLIAPVW